MLRVIVVFLSMTLLVSCSDPVTDAKSAISKLALDGDSVQVRDANIFKKNGVATVTVCGEFNASNVYGGKVGWKRFIASCLNKNCSVDTEESIGNAIEVQWKLHCR
ncbi:hypothetical protein [Chromobacterium phragmitis]|uniref:hypothetical protein n=1 Tax=Chromobacterium phragmitis TaxID=2202141 RepID=UPI0011AE3D85|nr:hypothetical protein [Chromobacterium phragmitis]